MLVLYERGLNTSETWIIFVAEPEQPGWESRKLPMGGLTDILDEQWDYSTKGATPQVGDRSLNPRLIGPPETGFRISYRVYY